METDFYGAPVGDPCTDAMLDAALGTLSAHELKPKWMTDEGWRMNMRRIISEALMVRQNTSTLALWHQAVDNALTRIPPDGDVVLEQAQQLMGRSGYPPDAIGALRKIQRVLYGVLTRREIESLSGSASSG